MSEQHESRAVHLAAWVGLFAALERGVLPAREALAACATEEVLFRDPFNEVRGHDAILRVLDHTRRNVKDVKVQTLDTAWSESTAYLKWEMTGRVRYVGHWSCTGMSEIGFAPDGRIASHVDHWDTATQLYAHLPVVGWLCRRMLRMGAV